MFKKNNMTAWEKEWNALQKREQAYLMKSAQREVSNLNKLLEEKIPEKLQNTLVSAFEKAFKLIFEKGSPIIEKTYRKDELEKRHKMNRYSAELYGDRKHLKAFSKSANASGVKNLLVSSAEGLGLGILGIGIPDIPLFTGVMLKSIYEIALRYGYAYDSDEEKYFILEIICGAFSDGENIERSNEAVNEFMEGHMLPEGYSLNEHIQKVAVTLSGELLYMKFLQGIPIIGIIGGAYDSIYLQMVLKYAKIKYYRRFLVDCREKYG